MIAKALENCDRKEGVSPAKIVRDAINWQDLDSYRRHLTELRGEPPQFDVIINTGNSFCHIPPIRGQVGLALANFHEMLRPGGLLMIDTKRYVQDTPLLDENDQPKKRPVYREMRFVKGKWTLRTEREESEYDETLGLIRFHTCMHYDVDESFGEELNRALIVLTVSGASISPKTYVIPYYPLPASVLEKHMDEAGFDVRTFPAPEDPKSKYRYDLVVGMRRA